MGSETKLCKRLKVSVLGWGKTKGEVEATTRADCGLWDEGLNKDGGSTNLTVYLSL